MIAGIPNSDWESIYILIDKFNISILVVYAYATCEQEKISFLQ
ncbi:MAG: hypothetical protein P9M11_00470 [Candidatus Tenebribacter burtonii]|nr:hypothetical protein [Candidatus Tenebribacter burtonii]